MPSILVSQAMTLRYQGLFSIVFSQSIIPWLVRYVVDERRKQRADITEPRTTNVTALLWGAIILSGFCLLGVISRNNRFKLILFFSALQSLTSYYAFSCHDPKQRANRDAIAKFTVSVMQTLACSWYDYNAGIINKMQTLFLLSQCASSLYCAHYKDNENGTKLLKIDIFGEYQTLVSLFPLSPMLTYATVGAYIYSHITYDADNTMSILSSALLLYSNRYIWSGVSLFINAPLSCVLYLCCKCAVKITTTSIILNSGGANAIEGKASEYVDNIIANFIKNTGDILSIPYIESSTAIINMCAFCYVIGEVKIRKYYGGVEI